jgi:hypothetical protein
LAIEIGSCAGQKIGKLESVADGPWELIVLDSDRNNNLGPISVCVPGTGNTANINGIIPTEAGVGPSDPPIANDDPSETAFVGETINIDVLANDSDPESQPLTIISVDTSGTDGTASCDSASCEYTATGSLLGPDTFTYTISDGDPGSADDTATVTVTVSVAPPNSPPVATDDDYGNTAGDILTGNVITDDTGNGADSDFDDDPLTATLFGPPPANAASFSLALDGSFSYQSTAGFDGVDTFQYFANDGTVDSNTAATVSITVTATAPPLTITLAECTRLGNGRCDWRFEGTKNTGTTQKLRIRFGAGGCTALPGTSIGITPAKFGVGPWAITELNRNKNLGLDDIHVCVPGNGSTASLLNIEPTEVN